MSMRPGLGQKILAMTVTAARAAFSKGCLAMLVRDASGMVFAVRGRPAVSPTRLASVLVLRYTENLTDRQAADAVRGRLDWKCAFGLELSDEGFDASVLSEFRAHLACDEAAGWLLGLLLDRLAGRGRPVASGRQHMDAICVLTTRNLNRLEAGRRDDARAAQADTETYVA